MSESNSLPGTRGHTRNAEEGDEFLEKTSLTGGAQPTHNPLKLEPNPLTTLGSPDQALQRKPRLRKPGSPLRRGKVAKRQQQQEQSPAEPEPAPAEPGPEPSLQGSVLSQGYLQAEVVCDHQTTRTRVFQIHKSILVPKKPLWSCALTVPASHGFQMVREEKPREIKPWFTASDTRFS